MRKSDMGRLVGQKVVQKLDNPLWMAPCMNCQKSQEKVALLPKVSGRLFWRINKTGHTQSLRTVGKG